MKCSIDSNTREIIFLDNSECFGVEFDKNTQRIEFSCPKIVGDNLDLTKCICRINYMNAKGYRDSYLIDDILADGDNITFTWKLKGKVTAGRGNCLFIFCARQVTETGIIEKEWNTTVAKASIKRGLETNSHIEEEYSDILESILLKINSVSLTTEVNAESTNENVPTAKAVYDALQDIGIPSGTDISLNVTGATVGQTIKVKAVDADGKPTAWEAVDMAAGDTEVWEKVCQVTTTENTTAIYQSFGGNYKKIRAIFLGESTAACQVWVYPNTKTLPAGRDVSYIFNAPYANAGKYTIIGEFSSSPYPAPNSSDNWYHGRCSVARVWNPQGLHAGWGDSLFDNYVNDLYAHLGEGDLSQGIKSLYWTHSAGEIKAGAQMVVYGVKA
jgi:hypothetical protein